MRTWQWDNSQRYWGWFDSAKQTRVFIPFLDTYFIPNTYEFQSHSMKTHWTTFQVLRFLISNSVRSGFILLCMLCTYKPCPSFRDKEPLEQTLIYVTLLSQVYKIFCDVYYRVRKTCVLMITRDSPLYSTITIDLTHHSFSIFSFYYIFKRYKFKYPLQILVAI